MESKKYPNEIWANAANENTKEVLKRMVEEDRVKAEKELESELIFIFQTIKSAINKGEYFCWLEKPVSAAAKKHLLGIGYDFDSDDKEITWND